MAVVLVAEAVIPVEIPEIPEEVVIPVVMEIQGMAIPVAV